MLTEEENVRLTRVGPGTPCGEMMRRYWHPIAATVQLDENPVLKVRILCEDLVLYRDRSGTLGLIDQRCPHRATSMEVGIPEDGGLRCAYHGWLFNGTGSCIEMPLAPPDSTYKERVSIKAYPVEELGGLIWAYLGPQPAPLLPKLDLFVRDTELRQIVGHMLPGNWLQVMENRGDQGHAIYLHGRLFQYALERQGRLTEDPFARYNSTMRVQADRLKRGAWPEIKIVRNRYGFTKGMRDSDQPDDAPWQLGGPVFFPYTVYPNGGSAVNIRQDYQIGVPIDDTTTWHISYRSFSFPPEIDVPKQERIPYAEVPLKDEKGEYILDYVLAQDMVAWYLQGDITDRTKEHLYEGDLGVIEYRKLLAEQIDRVMDGAEPINVIRDEREASRIVPTLEGWPEPTIQAATAGRNGGSVDYRFNFHKVGPAGWRYIDDDVDRYCPDYDLIVELYEKTAELMEQRDRESKTT